MVYISCSRGTFWTYSVNKHNIYYRYCYSHTSEESKMKGKISKKSSSFSFLNLPIRNHPRSCRLHQFTFTLHNHIVTTALDVDRFCYLSLYWILELLNNIHFELGLFSLVVLKIVCYNTIFKISLVLFGPGCLEASRCCLLRVYPVWPDSPHLPT